MKISELIERLEQIKSNYNEDLEVLLAGGYIIKKVITTRTDSKVFAIITDTGEA